MNYELAFLFPVFDEAALTDDLLLQLVEALKKHKESAKEKTETEATGDKEKEKTEGTVCPLQLIICINHSC